MDPLKALAELLHQLFCPREHFMTDMACLLGDRNPECCYWYLEENLENYWEQEDHKKELEKTEGFIQFFNLKNPEEALKVVHDLLPHIRAINEVISENSKLAALVSKMIDKG